MGSALNGTGITFSDATTLSTQPVTTFIGQAGAVDPTTLGNLGSIVSGCYAVASPTGNASRQVNSYTAGTTTAGSSIAYNITLTGSTTVVATGYLGTGRLQPAGILSRTHNAGAETSFAFPTSGAALGANQYCSALSFGFTVYTAYNSSITYSTLSGSWKSLSSFSIGMGGVVCGSNPVASWPSIFWQRYA